MKQLYCLRFPFMLDLIKIPSHSFTCPTTAIRSGPGHRLCPSSFHFFPSLASPDTQACLCSLHTPSYHRALAQALFYDRNMETLPSHFSSSIASSGDLPCPLHWREISRPEVFPLWSLDLHHQAHLRSTESETLGVKGQQCMFSQALRVVLMPVQVRESRAHTVLLHSEWSAPSRHVWQLHSYTGWLLDD